MSEPKVLIMMGSASDRPVMEPAWKVLDDLGVPFDVHVSSAHRSPESTALYARKARRRGFGVIIAGAGGSAHLAGVIASHTTLPVIGVPVPTSPLQGLDSLLSTVQMPPGVPVATVGVGQGGASNAGILAAQILALSDENLRKRIDLHRRRQRKKVEKMNAEIQESVKGKK